MQDDVAIVGHYERVSIDPELVRQRQLPDVLEWHVRTHDSEQVGSQCGRFRVTLAVEHGDTDRCHQTLPPRYVLGARWIVGCYLILKEF